MWFTLYPTVLHTKAFGSIHLSLQGGEGICRSTAKAGGRNQGQGRRGMVHVPFDTYGQLFDSLSLLGCHVGATAGCATAGTSGIGESSKYSSSSLHMHVVHTSYLIKCMYSSYMQYHGIGRNVSCAVGDFA